MTQQLQHQSAQPSEDSSQPTAPLWYEQTQVPTQYPAYSPAFPQAPAEPRFAAFTQPGATPAKWTNGLQTLAFTSPVEDQPRHKEERS